MWIHVTDFITCTIRFHCIKFSSVCYDFEGRKALTHANYFSFRGDYPFPKFASSAHFTKTKNLLVRGDYPFPKFASSAHFTKTNNLHVRGDYPFPKFASSAHFTKTNNLLVYSGHETPQNA